MKKAISNLIGFQIILSGLFLIISIPFYSCEPIEEPENDSLPPAKKPNIYIYPTEKSQFNINLIFPLGGKIITSIPDYGNGWTVSVDTSGIINDKYEYLFYESIQPDVWQINEGWTIRKSELKDFFIDNMLKYGFYGKEITDFTDYWIPRLTNYEYYEIYPQEIKIINSVIKLDISKTPDNILRLFYLIKGTNINSDKNTSISTSDIQFNRTGFFVTEWGVILK